MVVGGGMSGLTAAVEAAEIGAEVYIVEKRPFLGGRVAQVNQYFPKLCPPNCGLEINFQRIKKNPKINFITNSEVEGISGEEGNFNVTVKTHPRYVNDNCTACGKCVEACPTERENDFNFGMDKTSAIYLPHEFSMPMRYVIDGDVCKGTSCNKCVEACPYNAIDLNMEAKNTVFNVGSIVWAAGWNPYDAENISYYGFGQYADVVNNVMMERLAAPNGPTKGKIVRPSDGKEIENIAFIQCAGSRDENHLHCCSSVCCLASLKHATYVREQYPDAKITIYFIDIRARGKFEDFYNKVESEIGLNFIKGKPGEVKLDNENGKLIVHSEDQLTQTVTDEKYDMVVLATGMAPVTRKSKVPANINYDEDGFVASDSGMPGIYAAGCVKHPMDVASCVRDATSAAMKAFQSAVRGQDNG